jgi:hypothetical protein
MRCDIILLSVFIWAREGEISPRSNRSSANRTNPVLTWIKFQKHVKANIRGEISPLANQPSSFELALRVLFGNTLKLMRKTSQNTDRDWNPAKITPVRFVLEPPNSNLWQIQTSEKTCLKFYMWEEITRPTWKVICNCYIPSKTGKLSWVKH